MRKLQFRIAKLDEVKSLVDDNQPVAFDVETIGLYGSVRLAQFYQSSWTEALIVESPDIFQLAATIRPWHLVCHNISYEVSTIQTQLGLALGKPMHNWVPTEWDDTLLLTKLEYWKKEKFALDDCYVYYFMSDIYASHNLNKDLMHKANWSGALTTAQYQYAAIDVFYLLELYNSCSAHLTETYYLLDKSATSLAFSFQTNGLPVNEQLVKNMIAENNVKIAKLNCPINVNSWKQVRPFIGEDESDGLALATFALEGNSNAGLVNEVRKLTKQNSFLQKYLDTAVNGRIYGKFTFTTKSGRGNCKDQNLQQLPRKTKSVFEAPEGSVLVMSDFAQLELRYGCAVTNEQVMAERFKNNEDLHTFTADMMSVPRQQAKTCNFNLLYGGSANMLRAIFIATADTLLPISQVTVLKKKWHNLWPTLTAWQEKCKSDWRAGNGFETLLGRKMFAKLFTDAMNLPIQGGSADISKLAMHKMFKEVQASPRLANHAKFVNFVHDSFMWECPDNPDLYVELAKITATAMKEAWTELVAHTAIPDLPMPVDVVVGKNWGNLDSEIEIPIYSLTI